MMMYKKEAPIIITLIAASFVLYFGYRALFKRNELKLYRTAPVQKRNITQIIKALGYLEPQDELRLSSVIEGVIRKLHVKENEYVKKGQLLVDIDDGREDTLVKEAQADLKKSEAILKYQRAFYERQKKLYKDNHISKDAFELATQNYESAIYDVELKKATLAKEEILFSRKKITAPVDGVIIQKTGAEGEAIILDSPPPHIYKIAKDITKMIAKLKIDEEFVGVLKENSKATLIFDAYPHKVFTGTITGMSQAPHKENGTTHYLATIPIDNTKQLFRPGMNLNARITLAKKEGVISVPNQALNLNRDALKKIASIKKLGFKSIKPEEKEQLLLKGRTKTIWLFKDNALIERHIQIGIYDDKFFEVISGLDGSETIVVSTAQSDEIEKSFLNASWVKNRKVKHSPKKRI